MSRAKSKDGGKVLRDKLERIGMELPSGLFLNFFFQAIGELVKRGLNQINQMCFLRAEESSQRDASDQLS